MRILLVHLGTKFFTVRMKILNIFIKYIFLYLFWIVELTQYHPTPPLSPELPGSCRKEFKENKEPSPKAKRKKGVKISSVALDSIHWQNDSVQIIASASDLKSMDEFLLKKVHFACWVIAFKQIRLKDACIYRICCCKKMG